VLSYDIGKITIAKLKSDPIRDLHLKTLHEIGEGRHLQNGAVATLLLRLIGVSTSVVHLPVTRDIATIDARNEDQGNRREMTL